MYRIVYDYQTFGLQRHGGISRYFCELAARVHQSAGLSAHVVAPLHINDYLDTCEVPRTAIRLSPPIALPGRLQRGINKLVSPFLVRQQGPSLIHRTYYSPFNAMRAVPTVVTVFDMIHELYATEFAPSDRTSLHKRQCVERAQHVVCISHSTAADLMRLFSVARERISVTHLGYSSVFDARPEIMGTVADPSTRPYLLYVGQRRGYKGFDDALKAYAGSPRLRADFDFVVFGGSSFSAGELSLIRSLSMRDGAVRHLQGDDVALAATYRAARAFVYPSRYEGFGIPPLEAMASGCPVICAGVSSLPEVVGDAAQCFDPNEPDSLLAAMELVCFDETRRLDLVQRGFERVRSFSWDQCARETASIYRRVLAE